MTKFLLVGISLSLTLIAMTASAKDVVARFTLPDFGKASFATTTTLQKWESFTSCQKSFMLGFAAYKAGRLKEAEDKFLICDGKYPELQDHITDLLKKIKTGGEKFTYVDPAKAVADEIEILKEEDESPNKDFDLAKAYFKARNYKRSAELFEKVLSEKPFRLSSLEYLATSLVRQSKTDEAIKTNKKIIDEYERNKEARRKAHFKVGFIYIDTKDYGNALKEFEHLRKKFPTHRRFDVLWYIGWCNFRLGNFKSALRNFEALEKIGGKEWKHRAKYWQARMFEEQGDKGRADKIYREIVQKSPRGYYGFLSAIKLGTPPSSSLPPSKQPAGRQGEGESKRQQVDEAIQHDQLSQGDCFATLAMTAACELDKMGISELVAKELEKVVTAKKKKYNEQKVFDLAVKNNAWRIVYLLGVHYPKAYPKIVAEVSAKNKVDPNFAWAILREESAFRPDVISKSSAVGLMQLMPATAERMAKLKKIDFQLKDLFSPKYNIELGIKYLSFLLKYFKGNLYYTAAAYNAGEEAVDRWITTHDGAKSDGANCEKGEVKKGEVMGGSDCNMEEFVEEIPFKETQDYVRKVMKSYWVYRSL